MDLDDILALAEAGDPTPLELTRARRVAREVQSRYDRSVAEGIEILVDMDPIDPMTAHIDEATRISRSAQLAKLGTITWMAHGPDDPGTAVPLVWSDDMAMILGYPPGATRLSVETLISLIHPADVEKVRGAVEAAWEGCVPGEISLRVIQHGGNVRHVHCHIEVLTDAGNRRGIVATGEDVTALELARQERRRLAKRSEMIRVDLAANDSVTGLPTRSYITDEVDRARRTTAGALVVVSTDPANRLPEALTDNDRDRLTADIARCLRAIVGNAVTCGLAGPGLWAILLSSTDEQEESAESLALRVVDGFRRHLFTVRQKTLRLTTSAGLVRFSRGDPETGFDLLIDAETAARDARRNGNSIKVLDQPVPGKERAERCRSRVRRLVADNRFALYAQPILDLGLNQVTHHEILLRVRSDTGEAVAPWAFLDMAERVGGIVEVDKWVIDHALELVGQGAQTSHYQINVSGKSVADPSLLTFVTDAIRRHDVKPECVTFEITETALIENRNEALAFAQGIRQLGCRLALDDFGTGYGALAHLRILPVDLVKIDGVFIADLCRSAADQVVVSMLVGPCHELGIRVGAEYVQDEETINLLRSYGVDFAQGYHVGRPEPIAISSDRRAEPIEMELRLPPERTALG